MKQLFFLFILCGITQTAKSQNGTGGCHIKYEYDLMGNRVKRSKVCLAPGGGGGGVMKYLSGEVIEGGANEVIVYPNPASNFITIETRNPTKNGKIVLLDLMGKVIFEASSEEYTTHLKIGNLASGVYFIKYHNVLNGETFIKNLVIE